jgi:methanogenic corrinoid protein MtbC1
VTEPSPIRTTIEAALAAHDRPAAIAAALDAVDSGDVSIEDLYRQLSGMLVEIGAAWQRGESEVWQEHFATSVVRTIVESCALRVEAAAPADRTKTILFVAPADEFHDLGLRMLADRFTLAGWRAQILGANVPLSQILEATLALGADAVALSASTHFHRTKLRAYTDALATQRPDVRVWVGGPAFAHDHAGWEELILDTSAIPAPGAA